ncbi:energy transducer TonB [uncultured Duncaniella sp.]|uniref:energy transducer TonB n=2 Tax=uncultured Duncaniella sp. TaxID=2768039 RepID=UPI00262A2AB3|nr:energy transducer TonB [uncultured Duncaniella sp.]
MIMARGKQTCKILKEIRRQIAEANDIEFVTSECRYKGDCLGTCPKCEAEVRYLEQQLRARQLMGKAVVLAGLSAGMIAFLGCGSSSNQTADDSDMLQGEPMVLLDGDDELYDEGEIDTVDFVFDNKEVKKEGEMANIPDVLVTQDEPQELFAGVVELQPEFPGGESAMMNFIAQNLKYPKEQLDSGIQGRVIVKFKVDTLGNVREPTIVRGKDSALDREAIRLVKSFPRFSPGMLNGKKVNVWFTLPIVFKLPEE